MEVYVHIPDRFKPDRIKSQGDIQRNSFPRNEIAEQAMIDTEQAIVGLKERIQECPLCHRNQGHHTSEALTIIPKSSSRSVVKATDRDQSTVPTTIDFTESFIGVAAINFLSNRFF